MIDTHLHLFSRRFRYDWMTGLYGSLALREDDGPPRESEGSAILVQARSSPDETAWLLERARSPRIAGVVAWTDLAAGDATERIDELIGGPSSDRVVGLRHQATDEPDAAWLSRPPVRHAIRHAGARDLVFDLLITGREAAAAVPLVDSVPETRFVLDHGGNPGPANALAGWRETVSQLSERPNVAIKLSGLSPRAITGGWTGEEHRAVLAHLISSFGEDRLLWGSDWPVTALQLDYAGNRACDLALIAPLVGRHAEALLDANAVRWYRLEERS